MRLATFLHTRDSFFTFECTYSLKQALNRDPPHLSRSDFQCPIPKCPTLPDRRSRWKSCRWSGLWMVGARKRPRLGGWMDPFEVLSWWKNCFSFGPERMRTNYKSHKNPLKSILGESVPAYMYLNLELVVNQSVLQLFSSCFWRIENMFQRKKRWTRREFY